LTAASVIARPKPLLAPVISQTRFMGFSLPCGSLRFLCDQRAAAPYGVSKI
jgi:hypothetical protein